MGIIFKVTFILAIALFSSIFSNDNILVFYPEGEDFTQMIESIQEEIGDEFTISKIKVSKNFSLDKFNTIIKKNTHKVTVLCGNRSILYYKQYLKSNPLDSSPTIQLMALKIEEKGIPLTYNTSGISYEIPIVTSLTKLRNVTSDNMNNIGIIYRAQDEHIIKANLKYCTKENFNFKVIRLENQESPNYYKKNRKKALYILIKDKDTKTIWIPNDNKLLSAELIKEVWKPITESNETVVITGISTLVTPKFNFATYATTPSSSSLGFQASELIFELKDNNWKFTKPRIEPPLSIYDVLDYYNAKRRIEINNDNLTNIGTILKH